MSPRKLVGFFVRGSLVVIPLAATLYILWLILATLDQILPVGVPGLGLILTVTLITAVGFLTSNVVGRTFIETADRLLARVPLVKLLYSSIKDLIGAFVGEQKRFTHPVAVYLSPGSPVKVLGFVTRPGLHFLGMHDHVAVYLPQSYNFAGNLLLVPSALVEPLDANSADVMTFVVSGGVSGFGVGQSLPPPAPAPTKTQVM